MKKTMAKILFSSNCDEWRTPVDLFDRYNDIFGFNLDVCATEQNKLCEHFFTEKFSCLVNPWIKAKAEAAWMNPPYGKDIGIFTRRAIQQTQEHKLITVSLLPARTDTAWFQELIKAAWVVDFLKGRVKFTRNCDTCFKRPTCKVYYDSLAEKKKPPSDKYSAPFPSAVVILRG